VGKTKIKTIDDSEVIEQKKEPPMVKKVLQKGEDSLVAKLKEELGLQEESPSVIANPEGAKQSKTDRSQALLTDTEEIATPATPRNDKPQKPGKAKPRSKKYLEASKELDRSLSYPLTEALDLVKKNSYSKFPGTLEAHINTVQTGIRGLVSLPFSAGKKLHILVFGNATEGANLGTDATIEELSKGKVDYDLIITTAEWMPKLAKAAKVLGPKGLMPNPKNATITTDLKKAVESFQAGKTEYKTESKAPVIHLALGKLNQPNNELEANLKILLSTLGKGKIKKVTLSPTMGPGVKLDLTSI